MLCEEEVEEEEPVAEECLVVPLVMGLGRTLAKDRLLAVRASLLSYNVPETLNRKLYLTKTWTKMLKNKMASCQEQAFKSENRSDGRTV